MKEKIEFHGNVNKKATYAVVDNNGIVLETYRVKGAASQAIPKWNQDRMCQCKIIRIKEIGRILWYSLELNL